MGELDVNEEIRVRERQFEVYCLKVAGLDVARTVPGQNVLDAAVGKAYPLGRFSTASRILRAVSMVQEINAGLET